MTAQINTTLSDVFKSTTMGDVKSALGDALYGINHRQTPGAVPVNRDQHGLVFFTRPQFNLTDGNASAERKFIPLLTTEDLSIQRMVRKLLDPRIELPCPIVDDKSAFIPILTNHLLSLTGWPDPVLDYHTSKPDVYKGEFSLPDSITDKYSAYTLSATWRNAVGDAIPLIFDTWQEYMSGLYLGKFMPYPDFIVANEYDFNTRIYRIVLDKNKRLVQKIACCGASFPYSNPVGASFDYDHDQPRNSGRDSIPINFRAMGYRYNDHIIIQNFNAVVGYFNPSMRIDPDTQAISPSMKEIPIGALSFFNNKGYPRIDPDTLELKWYVSQGQYNAVMDAWQRNADALNGPPPSQDYQPD